MDKVSVLTLMYFIVNLEKHLDDEEMKEIGYFYTTFSKVYEDMESFCTDDARDTTEEW